MMGRWGGRGGPREARKAERVARGWRERETETERGGRRKQRQQQLEKSESGKKWEVVNRALTGSPKQPPSYGSHFPPQRGLHPLPSHSWLGNTAGTFSGEESPARGGRRKESWGVVEEGTPQPQARQPRVDRGPLGEGKAAWRLAWNGQS